MLNTKSFMNGCCAILFNKDNFYPDISVKSIYIHDTRRCVQDQNVEEEQGWVLQGVLSRATFRWAAGSVRNSILCYPCISEGVFIIPALDTRSQILSIKDRRNGIGKPVFKLSPFGSGQLFALIVPDLRVPGVPLEVLQQVISQASTANV